MRSATFLFALLLLPEAALYSSEFDLAVGVYFRKHCISCHGSKKQQGEFRIDTLSENVGVEDTALWAEVRERISSGEMPPEDAVNPPTAEQNAEVVEWLSARIKEGEAARMATRRRVSFQQHRVGRPIDGRDSRRPHQVRFA